MTSVEATVLSFYIQGSTVYLEKNLYTQRVLKLIEISYLSNRLWSFTYRMLNTNLVLYFTWNKKDIPLCLGIFLVFCFHFMNVWKVAHAVVYAIAAILEFYVELLMKWASILHYFIRRDPRNPLKNQFVSGCLVVSKFKIKTEATGGLRLAPSPNQHLFL